MEDIIDRVRAKLPKSAPAKITAAGLQLPFAPGDLHDFDEDERAFGFPLPPLLKRLYTEIGNGRFGPGYGLTGLKGGYCDPEGTAVEWALRNHATQDWGGWPGRWPVGYLPICHWGCNFYSAIDCTDPAYRMLAHSYDHADPETLDGFFDQGMTFDAWIAAWAEGQNLWHALTRVIGEGYARRKAPREAQQEREAP